MVRNGSSLASSIGTRKPSDSERPASSNSQSMVVGPRPAASLLLASSMSINSIATRLSRSSFSIMSSSSTSRVSVPTNDPESVIVSIAKRLVLQVGNERGAAEAL